MHGLKAMVFRKKPLATLSVSGTEFTGTMKPLRDTSHRVN